MPDKRPPGIVGHGPFRWPKWLRSINAWEPVRQAGVYSYEQNAVTGARRAVRLSYGGPSPIDQQWLDGGEWGRPDKHLLGELGGRQAPPRVVPAVPFR